MGATVTPPNNNPVAQIRLAALAEIASWIAGAFPGSHPVNPERDLGQPRFSHAWIIPVAGECTLGLLVPPEFPFALPKIKIIDPHEAKSGAHVDPGDLICIVANAQFDQQKVIEVVQDLLERARELIRDNRDGAHDQDFLVDFEAYWRRERTLDTRQFYCLVELGGGSRPAAAFDGKNAVFVFENERRAKSWWKHKYGEDLKSVSKGAVVHLARIPLPSEYPSSGWQFARMVAKRCTDAAAALHEIAMDAPPTIPVVLEAVSPSGALQRVGIVLEKPVAGVRPGKTKQNSLDKGFRPRKAPLDVLLSRYRIRRADLIKLDAAQTRLPNSIRGKLFASKVALVGCGALGAGVAQMLVQSGVGSLLLVDPELLNWDNIGRHVLGADYMWKNKAEALKKKLTREFPQVAEIEAVDKTIQSVLIDQPHLFDDVDLLISCTGDWGSDLAVQAHHVSLKETQYSLIYGWMEAYACAGHAVLCSRSAPGFSDGFDAVGTPLLPATLTTKPPPLECGAATTQFGAVELANVQSLVAALAISTLTEKMSGPVWRSWLSRREYLEANGVIWNPEWIASRGDPVDGGMLTGGAWPK